MGCPGAGKSTWTRNHINIETDKYISRDEIRFSIVSEDEEYFSKEKQIYAEYIRQINENLKAGYNVFADATHLNRSSRNKLLRNITVKPSSIEVIWIKTPLEECINRNAKRAGTRSYVPESQLRSMYGNIEAPNFDEGFNKIYIVEDNQPINLYVNADTENETYINQIVKGTKYEILSVH
jgi:predicted kinase